MDFREQLRLRYEEEQRRFAALSPEDQDYEISVMLAGEERSERCLSPGYGWN